MSPISQEKARLYPKTWKAISRRVRFERARGRCECSGECGRRHVCWNPACPTLHTFCSAEHGKRNPETGSKVVLTVAHLCRPRDHRPPKKCGYQKHLRAMCQACHLRLDARERAENAGRTRDLKRGQRRFFDA